MKYICQSCGMPLARDKDGGGSNADGTKSTEYCSLCYRGGQFTSPTITSAPQMQAFVQSILQRQGYPKPVAWLMTLRIPTLARWKKR